MPLRRQASLNEPGSESLPSSLNVLVVYWPQNSRIACSVLEGCNLGQTA